LRENMNNRFQEFSKRMDDLNKRIDDLREDMDRRFSLLTWEVRIWFMVLALLMTLLTFLKK